MYAALKARKMGLYLSGPELSSLRAGVCQRDGCLLMCNSQLVDWTTDNLKQYLLIILHRQFVTKV